MQIFYTFEKDKMKKSASILLLFLYLASISGVAVSQHFCCGRLASVEIQLAAEGPGQHSQQPNDKKCCDDDSQIFEIHAPQQASVNKISFKAPVLSIPAFSGVIKFIFLPEENYTVANNYILYSSPPRAASPLFARNESFLI